MPVDKVRGGYRVRSYVTGKLLKRVYKTRAANRAAATSKRRSQRKRSTGSRRARRRY